jgi:hypothetical protein
MPDNDIGHIRKEWFEKRTLEETKKIFCAFLDCKVVEVQDDLSVFAYVPLGDFYLGTWLNQKEINQICEPFAKDASIEEVLEIVEKDKKRAEDLGML